MLPKGNQHILFAMKYTEIMLNVQIIFNPVNDFML